MPTKLGHQVFCHLILIQGGPLEEMIAKCGHHRRRDNRGAPAAVVGCPYRVEVLHFGTYASNGALAAAYLFGDLGVTQGAELDHAGQLLMLSSRQFWGHLRWLGRAGFIL
jgi:hypothetical protein